MKILERHVRRGRRTASRIWGRTAVVLVVSPSKSDLKKGKFPNKVFELSPTGTLIWKLLENRPKIREVVEQIAQKKRVSRNIATKMVVKFIKNLVAKEIVDILDGEQ